MTNKFLKCSTPLAVRKIAIKIPLRIDLRSVRIAMTRKPTIVSAHTGVEKEESLFTVGGSPNCCYGY